MKEEVNHEVQLALLRDEEEYFREQCRLLLESGEEQRALQFDDLANEVSDEIESLT